MRDVLPDTNVFVAAAFKPGSASAEILRRVRDGELRLVWNDAVRRETERVLRRIPPVCWEAVADLFREEDRYAGETCPERFDFVADPEDRKFAALAEAAGAVLITSDRHLLQCRGRLEVPVLTPVEFWEQFPDG